MSSLAEQHERIERYLQGAMTPGERDEFDQKMSQDADLTAAVALHRELAETLAKEGVHQVRQTIKKVDAKWKPPSGGGLLRFLRSPSVLGIAASLLLLVGFFAWQSLQGPSNLELATANFEQMPLQLQMGSYEDNIPQLRNEANAAYVAADYAQAIELFLDLAEREPFNLDNQLFAGISQVGNQEANAAIATLQPLADGDDASVQTEASWYLALAFLHIDDAASAKIYLEKIVAVQGFNWERAADLLEIL